MTSSVIFQSALAAHRAGRFNEAEQGYLLALQHDARNADACHMLGVVLEQRGSTQEAESWIRKALALNEDARYLCDLGILFWKAGRVVDAEVALVRAVALAPEFSSAAYNLGFQYFQAGRLRDAELQFHRVIEMQPDFMPAYHNLGVLLHQSGRIAEAETAFHQVLVLIPDQVEAIHMLALIHIERRDVHRAEILLRRALAVHENVVFLGNLGNLLSEGRRYAEAQACYERALVHDPAYPDVHFNFGNLLGETARPADAERCYRRTLAIAPDFAEASLNLGLLFQDAKRWPEAAACYRQALVSNGEFVEAWVNLGEALKLDYRQGEAEACLQRALTISPAFVKALDNLGVLYNETERRDEAEIFYRRALAADPEFANTYSNLGHLSHECNRPQEAESCYQRALQLKPDDPQIQLNYGTFQLLIGDYERGWLGYESRWKIKGGDSLLPFAQPRWLGDEDLRGKAILLYAEQGFGDTLQYVRYANVLQSRGATVWMLVPRELKSLVASCKGVAGVFTFDEALPHFDYQSPLMSMPLACGTSLQTIPSDTPYLFPDPSAAVRWQEKLGPKNALRVGLVWAGAPRLHDPSAQVIDRQRSMHFNRLLPLFEVEGVEFFNLQLGDDARRQCAAHGELIDHTADLHDFADSAALIANLDLVICVDTSVAHLTGATGKPFWLLNRYNTCSRWLVGREDSPWYPTARIFRQPRLGDWDAVIVQAKRALEELILAKH